MKNKLTLSTDRKSAAEGEYIEIKWACDACPDSLYLTFDSGYEKYSIAVADSGITRIPMKRSKSKTTITLKAVISGKKVSESVDVRVKNTKTSKGSKGAGISKLKLWKEKLQAGCSLQPRWNRMLEMGISIQTILANILGGSRKKLSTGCRTYQKKLYICIPFEKRAKLCRCSSVGQST